MTARPHSIALFAWFSSLVCRPLVEPGSDSRTILSLEYHATRFDGINMSLCRDTSEEASLNQKAWAAIHVCFLLYGDGHIEAVRESRTGRMSALMVLVVVCSLVQALRELRVV